MEEQSTGSIRFGVGVSSSDGPLVNIGVFERNLLGEGKALSLDASIAAERQSINLGYTERYFLGYDIDAGFDIFRIQSDNTDESSFKQDETGGRLRARFRYNDTTQHSFYYELKRRVIEDVASTASLAIRNQEGSFLESTIGHAISYDTRNSTLDPTDGLLLTFSNDLSGLGGDVAYFRARVSSAYYQSIYDDFRGIIGLETGFIQGWRGRDVFVANRYFLGGRDLRGFEDSGVGPRDTSSDDALGGKIYLSGTIETRFPLGLPDEFGVTGSIFNDFGFLSDAEETGTAIRDDRHWRSAIGAGLSFKTPIGPLQFSYAIPYLSQSYDRKQFFRFDFSTRF